MFESFDTSSVFDAYGDTPSIGGIQADVSSFEDIIGGKGNSEDYGRGASAVVGSFFGSPQTGADIGAKAFPLMKDIASNIWNAIK